MKNHFSLADQRKFRLEIIEWHPCIYCICPKTVITNPDKSSSTRLVTVSKLANHESVEEPAVKKVDYCVLFKVTY